MSDENRVFHVELDISMDYRANHEAFVIVDAFEEYASRQRWLAEDGPNSEFQIELAETADRLKALIDAQMGDANVRDGAATETASRLAVPTTGQASPLLYDWMAAELVAMADRMSATFPIDSLQSKMVSACMISVAEFVSKTNGSGSVSALSAIAERRGIDLDDPHRRIQ